MPIFAGGDWFPRAWNSDDGLPDNNVSGVVQTADGYLWVATLGGLMRFDGSRFEEFPPDNLPNVPGRGVRSLVLDRRQRLWLMLDRGIVACVETNSARVFTEADGLPKSQPGVSVEDDEGAIWIFYDEGRVVRILDGMVKSLGAAEGLPSGFSCSMTKDGEGRVWLAKNRQVCIFRDGRFRTIATVAEERLAVGRARSGGVWLCAGSRVLKLNAEGRREERTRLPTEVVPQVVFEDGSGALWIGTLAHGLFRVDDAGVQAVPTTHREISCVMEDREGNLWVGTGGGGLNRLRRRAVDLIGAKEGLPFESVRSVCEDAASRIWVVTQNGALLRRSDTGWAVITDATNWPGGRATCVAADKAGAVWIGTSDRGLVRWQGGKFARWLRQDGLVQNAIRSLMPDSRGNLWIAFPSGVQRMRGNEFKTFELPHPVRSIRAMSEDTHGDVWLGTSEGWLFRIGDKGVVDETGRTVGEPRSIRCVEAMADGSVWIGYAGMGLGRLKDGKFGRITKENGLHDNYVSQIMADDSGRLWLASNHGIFQLSLREAVDAIEGRAERVRSIVFTGGEGESGIQATYDNKPGAWRSRDGRWLVAARTGIAVINPANLSDNPDPPPVRLERVVVDGRTVTLYDNESPLLGATTNDVLDLKLPAAAGLSLAPDHRRLEVEFTALSLTAPENVRFRYQLVGLDAGWSQDSGERRARYSRLPAGEYTLRVIACNHSGVWNEAGATLKFRVRPFVWQTWWFRLAVLAVFTGATIGIVRYVSFRRLRRKMEVLERQAAVERERARIARDIHDDLGNRLTKTMLLSGFVLRDWAAPEKAEKHVRQISSTVRQATDALDEIVWAINPRNDTLPHLINYVGQFVVEFLRAAGVRCRVDLPELPPHRMVPAEIRHNLFLVVEEAINNVVKHAQATEVQFKMAATDGKISIEVVDNGRGFKEPPGGSAGDGLKNMRERMCEIGGECRIVSEPGKGTLLSFNCPLPRTAK